MICKVNDSIEVKISDVTAIADGTTNNEILLNASLDIPTYEPVPPEMLILLGEKNKITHIEIYNDDKKLILNSTAFKTLETANNYYDKEHDVWSINYAFVQH